MLGADRPLVGAEDPTLEKRFHAVDPRQQFMSLFLPSADDSHLGLVPELFHAAVVVPTVGVEETPRLDAGADKSVEAAVLLGRHGRAAYRRGEPESPKYPFDNVVEYLKSSTQMISKCDYDNLATTAVMGAWQFPTYAGRLSQFNGK